jgi:hypothetical protein
MEWLVARMISGYHVVEQITNWAVSNPGPAFFLGAFLWALLNTIVKLSPTKYDDIIVDILAKSIRAGFGKAIGRKGLDGNVQE